MNAKHFLVFLFFTATSIAINAQGNQIEKQKWHWSGDQDTTAGYAQAVRVGNILYISGTVALDVTPDGIRNVYMALQKTLEQYGAGFQHVVKENLYTTDIEAMKKYNHVRKAFYKGDFPAATWVQVVRLFMADAKLEVELVAHLPESGK